MGFKKPKPKKAELLIYGILDKEIVKSLRKGGALVDFDPNESWVCVTFPKTLDRIALVELSCMLEHLGDLQCEPDLEEDDDGNIIIKIDLD